MAECRRRSFSTKQANRTVISRVDTAFRQIAAPADVIYRAFAMPGAMERWLPPDNMTGEMLHFDFREGGSYRMRLKYAESQRGSGKTSEDYDEVDVRLTKLEDSRRIEQDVSFESEDDAFSGVMRMTWTFQPKAHGTLVTVRAENVPDGIRPEDHEAGLSASLAQLANFVEPDESRAMKPADQLEDRFKRYALVSLGPDPEQLAEFYDTSFLAAGPKGSAAFTNDEAFRRWLREVHDFNVSSGMTSMAVGATSAITVGGGFTLATVEWVATFQRTGDTPIRFNISYLLRESESGPRIAAYISHEDQEEAMRASGLL